MYHKEEKNIFPYFPYRKKKKFFLKFEFIFENFFPLWSAALVNTKKKQGKKCFFGFFLFSLLFRIIINKYFYLIL